MNNEANFNYESSLPLPVLDAEETNRELEELDDRSLIESLMEDIQSDIICTQPRHRVNPILDEFPGELNFQMIVKFDGDSENNYVYSNLLQNIYVNVGRILPLTFEWRPSIPDLHLRITMVFSLEKYKNDPAVMRLRNLLGTSSDVINIVESNVVREIVPCLYPETIYEEIGGHLSVLIPLRAESDFGYMPVNMQFFYHSMDVIFTLETQSGIILGKRRLPVRVVQF